MEMERKPGGRHRGANFVSPSGLMLRDPPYPSAYADGSSCVALRATEVSKTYNVKTHASGCEGTQTCSLKKCERGAKGGPSLTRRAVMPSIARPYRSFALNRYACRRLRVGGVIAGGRLETGRSLEESPGSAGQDGR